MCVTIYIHIYTHTYTNTSTFFVFVRETRMKDLKDSKIQLKR